VRLQVTDRAFEIEVQDYGMGVGRDQIARMETGALTRGCGMLLSRKLIEAMGGTWELENRPKHGAKITFRFPFPDADN
jgi:signal transduction histidine kinase